VVVLAGVGGGVFYFASRPTAEQRANAALQQSFNQLGNSEKALANDAKHYASFYDPSRRIFCVMLNSPGHQAAVCRVVKPMRPWMMYLHVGSAARPVAATIKPDPTVDPTTSARVVQLGPIACATKPAVAVCTTAGRKHEFELGADATLADLNK